MFNINRFKDKLQIYKYECLAILYILFIMLTTYIFTPYVYGWEDLDDVPSFASACTILNKQVFYDHQVTFYTEVPYDGRTVIPGERFMPADKYVNRSGTIEWEHLVPASYFGSTFPSFKYGHQNCVTSSGRHYKGRVCAAKINPIFKAMLSDLYNLRPAIGQVNAMRSDKPYCEVPWERRVFGGNIDLEIDKACIEIPDSIKGDVARTYLYMHSRYSAHMPLTEDEIKKYKSWAAADPVDNWEFEWAKRIQGIQGNANPYIK